jgi:hypothetical protein
MKTDALPLSYRRGRIPTRSPPLFQGPRPALAAACPLFSWTAFARVAESATPLAAASAFRGGAYRAGRRRGHWNRYHRVEGGGQCARRSWRDPTGESPAQVRGSARLVTNVSGKVTTTAKRTQ